MQNALLKIEDLTVSFEVENTRNVAVQNLSLSIDRGQIVCLIGESGSGKSSVAHAVMRLLPTNADCKGRVFFDGLDLLEISEQKMCSVRGKRAGMIFQEPQSALNPVLRVGSQVEEVLTLHSPELKATERYRKVIEMFRFIGFSEPEKRYLQYPHELSGGMRQRVVIAMALIMEPELLIADEPTTALDATIQAQILQLIARLKKDKEMGILFVTHDLGIVSEIADEVIVLLKGEAVERGSVKDVLLSPKHAYTRHLLSSIPTPSRRRQKLFEERL